jgi:lipooligosaccharide transport system permease protein
VNVIRPASMGHYSLSFVADILWMLAFTLIFYVVAAVLMKRRLKD